MDGCDGDCGPTGCELMRRTVLGMVRHGPVPLADIVMRLEAVLAAFEAAPPGISRCLQEMARSGWVALRVDGRGWRVSATPDGRALHDRLSVSGGWAAGTDADVIRAAGGPAYPR